MWTTKYLICSIFISLNFCFTIQGKVSIIIPCSYKHAQHLYSLLELYEKQTELPDEVVISLSEVHRVSPSIVERLQKNLWAFPVNLVVSNEKKYAGENRNRACQHARGDVLICQDADDLPHPQRVEVIKYFFNKYPINQLLHDWTEVEAFFGGYDVYELNKIPYIFPNDYQHIWTFKVHFGNVAISKQVFRTVKWTSMPRGQDVEFNKKVYAKFHKCIVIRMPLLVYRSNLSTIRSKDIFEEVEQSYKEKRYRTNFIYVE